MSPSQDPSTAPHLDLCPFLRFLTTSHRTMRLNALYDNKPNYLYMQEYAYRKQAGLAPATSKLTVTSKKKTATARKQSRTAQNSASSAQRQQSAGAGSSTPPSTASPGTAAAGAAPMA